MNVLPLVLVLFSAPPPAPALDVDLATDEGRRLAESFAIEPGVDFTVELSVQGSQTGEATYPLIGTKATIDTEPGWLLAADRSGAWRWHAADGEHRRDYLPTAARQGLFDGRRHRVAFTVIGSRRETRLFFDGTNVAIYAMNGMSEITGTGSRGRLQLPEGFQGSLGRLRVWNAAVEDGVLGEREPAPAPRTLRVMAWNIWHGGRENGAEVGVGQVVDVIRDSGADIVCMQETYGSGPAIADALGYHFYLRSTNLSIMSRWPIAETFDLFRPFNFGGARVRLGGGLDLAVFVVWLHYLPDFIETLRDPKVTADVLLEGERRTRGAEMAAIVEALGPWLASAGDVPVIVAGDFNCPSHLDWGAGMADRHGGLVVEWPVSRACVEAGLVDSYRASRPDPGADPGLTWSPRFGLTDRIDYVYATGRLRPMSSTVIDTHAIRFPSDHAAVVTEYEILPGPAAP